MNGNTRKPASWSSSTSASNNKNKSQPKFQSNFRHVLQDVPVPASLQEGLNVLRVFANGQTQTSFLTLSHDKFTLFVSTRKHATRKKPRSWFGRSTSVGSRDSSNAGTSIKAAGEERAIDIGSIHRIQRGQGTKRFEMARKHRQESVGSVVSNNSNTSGMVSNEDGELVHLNPSQSFSIMFRGGWTLDFMMMPGYTPPNSSRDQILDALDQILNTYQQQKTKVSNEVLLLRYMWKDASSSSSASSSQSSQTVNSQELGHLLDRMNHPIKKSQLNDLYDKFGKTIGLDRKQRRNGLTFEQTCTLLHKVKRDSWVVKPVNLYWNHIFGEFMKNGKPRQNVSDRTFLEKFLWKCQGETEATIEDVRKLFIRLNSLELPHVAGDSQAKDPTRIDKNRFEAYLLGADNHAFDTAREQFNPRSMRRPISEYFINSSHNTYLTGDQFTSNSSVDMYSNALYRGCKCLELDVWDGDIGADGLPVPVVWHGHTMTSKILFKEIIKALKLFLNFHPDTFPLLLSFENHCSIPYQEVMADQLVRILGKSLYIPSESSLNGRLPSPWDLRGRVVIKGRRPSNRDLDNYDTDDDLSDDGAPSSISGSDIVNTPPPQKKVHHRMCPALARLTLFHGCKLSNWDASVMKPTNHMHSFSENKVRSLCRKSDRRKWTVYNQSHMSRTYPAGSRVDSSNYMPILPWSVGCQLVALNFQTNDVALRLNDGRFRENGGCGYVLKPDALLEMQKSSKGPGVPMNLSIRILSGSCLPKPKDQRADKCIDPYVRVCVYDIRNGDREVSSAFQTSVVYNNGFFPIWNEEKFSFTVENPAVAMLHLIVYDKEVAPSSDTFIASASIPISCLRKGLRSVKLYDGSNTRSGAYDFASLLVEVKKGKADSFRSPPKNSSLAFGRSSSSRDLSASKPMAAHTRTASFDYAAMIPTKRVSRSVPPNDDTSLAEF